MRRFSLLISLLATLLTTLVVTGPVARAGTAVPPTLPTSIVSVGDSITRGYDVTLFPCFLSDCPQYSWSTGTSSSVNSQYAQLRQRGATVAATNAAKTGAKMSDLGRQLGGVASTTSVQYVTVLLGANDVCTSSFSTMTPTATFITQFEGPLSTFLSTHPNAYVFVSSIPNVRQLYDVLKSNSSARSTWRSFGICQSMLSSTITDTVREQVQAREIEYNSALESVCATYDRCRWDGDDTYDTPFLPTDVSTVDYFHPSISGQKKLAGVTWTASYWG